MEPRKQAIIDALSTWIRQRPGLEFANYGDITSYRAECRNIARDKRDAETLLAAVKWCDGITWHDIVKASESAYSGRLKIEATPNYRDDASGPFLKLRIDYCTGQYWPTEYRRAVCAVLASALWEYTREHAMPAPTHYRAESWAQLGKGREHWGTCMVRADAESLVAKKGGPSAGTVTELRDGLSPGDWLRAHFRKEFGRGIASRWFN